MYSKTIKILLFFVVLCSVPCVAQSSDDEQKQRESMEKKAQEVLDDRIQLFISDLNADDFQKEIIKQKLQSYYEKQKVLFMDATLKSYQRDESLNSLNATYFSDIKKMVSEDTMDKIQIFILDAGTTLEKQNKKKRKNKRKKDK